MSDDGLKASNNRGGAREAVARALAGPKYWERALVETTGHTKVLRDPDMIAADQEWQAQHPEDAE